MSSEILLADRLSGVESASEEELELEGNNSSGSGNNSPTLATSFFGKPSQLGKERKKKVKQVTFILHFFVITLSIDV